MADKYRKFQDQITRLDKKNLKLFEQDLFRVFLEVFKRTEDEILRVYRKYDLPIMIKGKPDGQATIDFMNQKLGKYKGKSVSRMRALQFNVREEIQPLFLKKDKMTEGFLSKQMQSSFFDSAWASIQGTGVDLKYGFLPPKTIELAVLNPPSKISDSVLMGADRARSIANINREIQLGLAQGESFGKMAKRIRSVTADPSKVELYKTLKVARTETGRVISLAKMEHFNTSQDLGLDVRLQLLAVLDSATRNQSANMDGQKSRADGRFEYPSSGSGNWYIAKNTGHPEWDINDREVVIETLEGMDPKLRRIRDEGIVPFKTFPFWAKEKGLKKNKYGQVYKF